VEVGEKIADELGEIWGESTGVGKEAIEEKEDWRLRGLLSVLTVGAEYGQESSTVGAVAGMPPIMVVGERVNSAPRSGEEGEMTLEVIPSSSSSSSITDDEGAT